jgi:hypothetical protein
VRFENGDVNENRAVLHVCFKSIQNVGPFAGRTQCVYTWEVPCDWTTVQREAIVAFPYLR